MELSSSHEGGIPLPLNSTFGGAHHGHGHLILHDHHPAVTHNHNIISSAAPQIIPISNNGGPSLAAASIDDSTTHVPYKKMVRYRECLKNHAASMGGTATDGCGEFMPSGEEGSIEALTCSACNCHRNFHRKEIEGEHGSCTGGDHCYHINNPHFSRVNGRKVILGHHKSILAPAEALCYPTAAGALIPSRSSAPHHQMIMSYNMGSLPSESDEQEDGGGAMMARPAQLMKKRFRTKFSQEQKEKMLNFAEKVGWKLQKQEETVVQQFCQEIGVKRRVLKVWMHNNKHSLAKMNPSTTTTTTAATTTTATS